MRIACSRKGSYVQAVRHPTVPLPGIRYASQTPCCRRPRCRGGYNRRPARRTALCAIGPVDCPVPVTGVAVDARLREEGRSHRVDGLRSWHAQRLHRCGAGFQSGPSDKFPERRRQRPHRRGHFRGRCCHHVRARVRAEPFRMGRQSDAQRRRRRARDLGGALIWRTRVACGGRGVAGTFAGRQVCPVREGCADLSRESLARRPAHVDGHGRHSLYSRVGAQRLAALVARWPENRVGE